MSCPLQLLARGMVKLGELVPRRIPCRSTVHMMPKWTGPPLRLQAETNIPSRQKADTAD